MVNKNRVMVIGLDGATFDIIKPMMEKGLLPNISKIISTGCHGKLKATIPILSPVSWTSFATGMTPGNHGIFDFLTRQEGSYDLAPSGSTKRLVKPLWKVAGGLGKKVIVLNVPATYPPDSVNGLMVSGQPAPYSDERIVYPPELFAELKGTLGKDIISQPDLKSKKKALKNVLYTFKQWTEVSKFVTKKLDWDLFVVVFTATDTIQHFFWDKMPASDSGYTEQTEFAKAVYFAYEEADRTIGEIIELVGKETNTVILSDHGFGPLHTLVSISEWLKKNGYLSFNKGVERSKAAGLKGLTRGMMRKFGLMGKLPMPLTLQGVDWANTHAYITGTADAIYINLMGREPQGIVKDGEDYSTIVDEVATGLAGLELPGGLKPIERVYKGRELYPGSTNTPDLLIKFNRGFAMRKEGAPTGNLFQSLRKWSVNNWTGTHREDGILIMTGPKIKNCRIQGAQIIDVAPTLYHLLGIPLPSMLDGRVLSESLRDGSPEAVKTSDMDIREDAGKHTDYSTEETQSVAEKLKSLGYLE